MSSENNHQSFIIDLTNYEDFFILYMDGELNEAQVVMVENFLVLHPHLQTEMDLLMNTRLPVEDFSVDKSLLLSHNMQAQTLQEELLLFIDDELPADKKKLVELEIAANPSYQKQLQLLTAAKLTAAENVLHPHKKELYRHTKKVLLLQPWMRIAAALLLLASMAVIYLVQQDKTAVVDTTAEIKPLPKTPATLINDNGTVKKESSPKQQVVATPSGAAVKNQKTFARNSNQNKKVRNTPLVTDIEPPMKNNDIANLPVGERQNTINYSSNNNHTRPQLQHSQISNAAGVTSVTAEAYNPVTASVTSAVLADTENNRKGSLKSFLRKAGRTITRTAGLSSGDDDDETLIGVVALKLK